MHLVSRVPRFILLVLFALTASGIVFYLADGKLAPGSMHNVVRNWEQYGLGTLQGKLVTNPGGYEALTRPHVHKGHRAASLYPVFFIKRLFAWTGAETLAVHVALSMTLLFSTWFLLGRSRIGWLAGVAAMLCPGYIRDQTYLDPNVIALLMGLPFAAIVLPLLARPSLSPAALAGLLLTIAAYTTLNWTTAFIHGMLLAYLIAARQLATRQGWLYVAAASVSLVFVAGISVFDKQGTCPSFGGFLGDYLWGSGGYGACLTTDRAAGRLLFVGTVGLLPLLLVFAYVLGRRAKWNPEKPWAAFLPLGAALLGVGVMRNYFGTVPWMAAGVFLAALVLSMRLIVERQKDTSGTPETQSRGRILAPIAFLAGCFVYASGVTVMATLHDSEARALVSLVRSHSARSDTIVLAEQDLRLAALRGAVADFTDRRVVVLNDLSAGENIGARAFLLSSSAEVNLPLLGKTFQPTLACRPWARELLAFYSTAVARRLPGDQGFRPGTCYLYKLDTDNRAADRQTSPAGVAAPR